MQKTLLFFAFALLSHYAHATTYLYFQNNTSLPFSISASQSGGSLATNRWGSSVSNITAWQPKTELLWTNRSTGITNGVDFYFDIRLVNASDTLYLKLKLRGTLTHSTLWQSISGANFAHTWYSDRNFHEETFTMQGRSFVLKYAAQMTAGDDDVYYALQEIDPFAPNIDELSDSNALNLLAYNIYMLTPPIAFTDQNERATEIPNHVHNYDAILFSEAFHNSARINDLLPALMLEYPFVTPVVDASGTPEDGGVFIASRWAIDTFAQIVYTDCDADDCLAAKGAMYARINKLGKRYHLFATHTQAWNDTQNVSTRISQLQQLRAFKDSLQIPANEAVFIGGDLNVDKIVNNQNEYFGMLDSLQAIEPTYLGHPLTYDADLNYYGSNDHEFLDYILPLANHLVPDTAQNEPIILRSIADDMWGFFDLSDHFALHGRFIFPTPQVPIFVENQTYFSPLPYPNPSDNQLFVPLASAADLLLLDALGRQILHTQIQQPQTATVSLAHLPSGVYFLHIHSSAGTTSHKIIKP
jgi:endonuclease/exonuclease/phosphatase family metal-dependent hydrolase